MPRRFGPLATSRAGARRHGNAAMAGASRFKGIRRMNDRHQIEEVGEKLRGMMPWIKGNALVDKWKNWARTVSYRNESPPHRRAFCVMGCI